MTTSPRSSVSLPTLSAPSSVSARKRSISVTLRSAADGSVKLSGKVKIKKRRRTYKLGKASKTLEPNVSTAVRLAVPKRTHKAITAAKRKHRRARATIKAVFTDLNGNTTTRTTTVDFTGSSSGPGNGEGSGQNYEGSSDQGERVGLRVEGDKLVLFNSIVNADCPNGEPPFPVAVYVGPSAGYPHELPLHGTGFQLTDYNRPGNTQVFSLQGHIAGGQASGTFSGHLNDPSAPCASSTVHWTASRVR
jgi:hypothetical protein